MSFQLCILASGSSGNCSVLRTPAGVVLIDAGIGPRVVAKRLVGTGVSLNDVDAVVLTHLDSDHFKHEWIPTLVKRGVRVFCHAKRRTELAGGDSTDFAGVVRTFYDRSFEPLPGVRFDPIPLAHDSDGSHGFVIEGSGSRIGYATDLGRVPDMLVERFCDLDILAIECNYDLAMQQSSGRPWFLQHRITGGRGHLSNEQCFDAIRKIFDRCERAGHRLPGHIVLLHRSRQCNCPTIIRSLFEGDPRIATRLRLTEQYERTEWLTVEMNRQPLAGEQLSLQWV